MQSAATKAGKKPKSSAPHVLAAKRDALENASTPFAKAAVAIIDIVLKGYEDKREPEDIYDTGRFIGKLGDSKIVQDAIDDVLSWAYEVQQDEVVPSAPPSDNGSEGEDEAEEDEPVDEDDKFDAPIMLHPNSLAKTASDNFAFEFNKLSQNKFKGAMAALRKKHEQRDKDKSGKEDREQVQEASESTEADKSSMTDADRWKKLSRKNMLIDGEEEFDELLNQNPFHMPDVAHKKSSEAQAFNSKVKFRVLILQDSDEWKCVPRNFENTVVLQATITGGLRDAVFVLKADPTEEYPHTPRFPTVVMKLGSVQFSTNPDHMSDVVSVTKEQLDPEFISVLKSEYDTEREPVVIRVVIRGIRKSGCGPPRSTGNIVLDKEYGELLNALDSLPEPPSRRAKDVREFRLVTVPFNDRGDEILGTFFGCFDTADNSPKPKPYNMHLYLNRNGITAPYGHIDCRTRRDAFEDGKRPPVFPQRAYSKSKAEKQVVLTNGMMIEHLYDQARANRFSSAIHSICFIRVKEEDGMKLTYALLQADKSVLKSADIEQPENNDQAERVRIQLKDYFNSTEEVDLLIDLPGIDRPARVKGKMHSLTGHPWDSITFFAALVVKRLPEGITCNDLSDIKALRWRPCKFNTKKSDQTLTSQFHYISTFLKQPMSQAWIGLKKEAGETLPTLSDSLTAEEIKFVERAVDFAVAEFKLNSQQEHFLRRFIYATCRTAVCAGCGGSGKTVLMAIVACIGEMLGRELLLFAPTNVATDSQWKRVKSVRDRFKAKFNNGQGMYGELSGEPVRLHTRGYESRAIFTLGNTLMVKHSKPAEVVSREEHYKRLAEAFDQEAKIAATEHGITLDQQKKFGNYDSSAAKQIEEMRNNGTQILVTPYYELEVDQRTYYDVDANPFFVEKGSDPPMVDAVAFLGRCWEKKQGGEPLTAIEAKIFSKYAVAVTKEMLGEVPILITTIGNVLVNEQIKHNFARDKRGYWVLCDETTMALEADIITAMMMVVPSERWEKEFKDQCPLELVGLFGDPRQMYARLMSEKKNEFRELMKLDPLTRSIMCGHDSTTILDQQHRAHVDIWQGSSGIGNLIYKGTIQAGEGTGRTDPGRQISPGFIKLMARFIEKDPEMFFCEDQALALERRKILHRCLLNVANTKAGRSVAGSQFNGANLATYKRFVWSILMTKLDEGGQVYDMGNKMVYTTPYTAQRNKADSCNLKMMKVFNEKHSEHKITIKDLPDCKISDQLQSEEYEFVWYDTVVDKKLGFLNDNRRVATHLTRAQNHLWVIGNPEVTAAEREAFAKSSHSGGSGRRDEEPPLLPAFFGGQAVEGLSVVIDEEETVDEAEDIYMGINLAPKPTDDEYTNHINGEQFEYEKMRPGISLAKYDYRGMLKEEEQKAAEKDKKSEDGDAWGSGDGEVQAGAADEEDKDKEWVPVETSTSSGW